MAANNGLEETKLNKDYTLVYNRTAHHRQLCSLDQYGIPKYTQF